MYGSQLYDLVSRAYREEMRGGAFIDTEDVQPAEETLSGGNILEVSAQEIAGHTFNIEKEINKEFQNEGFTLRDHFSSADFDRKF